MSFNNGRTNGTRISYFLAAFASLTTFAVYLTALRNDFVDLDDYTYVVDNLHIRSLDLPFLKWAFLDFYASNWHPLTWASHALDYAVWGLNPLGHHLTNNILHAINTFLVVLLSVKLLEISRERFLPDERSTLLDGRGIIIAAGVTGLLFGLHPLHVESVAWISERKDLLCGLFFLLSISAYANYVRVLNNGPVEKKAELFFLNKAYLGSLVFFILAILSKPMAVSLPAVLSILDWYPFRRIRSLEAIKSVGLEKVPFLLGSIVSSILTIMAQRTGGAMKMMAFVPLRERMLVAAEAFASYLVHMAAPIRLSVYYPYPEQQGVALLLQRNITLAFFIVTIAAILIFTAIKKRVWLSALGYYVVTLIPVIGVVQVGSQSMADRYTYLPSLGPFLLVGLTAAWIWAKTDSQKRWGLAVKGFSTAIVILLFVSMSYATLMRVAVWKNDLTLFTDLAEKSPKEEMPYISLGNAYLKRNQLDEAIYEYSYALKLNPNDADIHYNLGNAYLKQNQIDEAIYEYSYALRLDPNKGAARHNLEICYERRKATNR